MPIAMDIHLWFDWFAINQFWKRKFSTIKAALFTWCVDIVKSEMILTWREFMVSKLMEIFICRDLT